MDDKKAISSESFREIKDISSFPILMELVFRDIESQDQNKLFLLKKVIRIAEALYLVSDTMSDKESLRTELRSQGLELVDMTFSYALLGDTAKEIACTHILARIGWLIHIAYVSGFITNTSAELLQNALIDARGRLKKVEPVLSGTYFSAGEGLSSGSRSSGTESHKERGIPRQGSSKNTERREAIMTYVKGNPRVGVKDVLSVIPGVSEKTIQRELLALVDEGVLKKEGERRWTQYSMK